jgi:molecular chaperone GrpE
MEKKKKAKPDKHEDKLIELVDTLQHLQAEFENYKKRMEKDKELFMRYSNQQLIAQLLPILDSFDQAIKHKDNQGELVAGLELIQKQLTTLLSNYGLRRIDAVGQKFDPYKHECLIKEESDKEGLVLEELCPGYQIGERIVRFSKVKVGAKKEVKDGNNANDNKAGSA